MWIGTISASCSQRGRVHEHAFCIRSPDRGQARQGRGRHSLLTGALPLAEAEPGTIDWFAARTSPTTFWIFDTFGSEDARQAHINGEIAAALMAKADELLASPPEILAADVLAR